MTAKPSALDARVITPSSSLDSRDKFPGCFFQLISSRVIAANFRCFQKGSQGLFWGLCSIAFFVQELRVKDSEDFLFHYFSIGRYDILRNESPRTYTICSGKAISFTPPIVCVQKNLSNVTLIQKSPGCLLGFRGANFQSCGKERDGHILNHLFLFLTT